MKLIAAFFISTLFLFFFVLALVTNADQIKLQWTYPEGETADGFKIFYKTAAGAFDYTKPAAVLGADERNATITVPGIAGKITAYQFTARAFRAGRDSEDSNQCESKIDLAPISKPESLKCFIDVTDIKK